MQNYTKIFIIEQTKRTIVFMTVLKRFLLPCFKTCFKHRGEAELRKHLRTFEENQISNIIRRTKGGRTLKFHEFYNIQRQKISERIRISLENHSSPTENSKNPIFLNGKPLKTEN